VTTYSITIIASANILKIGITETFTANYVGSDGSSVPITDGKWGDDNDAVATVVEATGAVTIVGVGQITIFVDYKGIRGTILIRGIPDFQGTWSGTYAVTKCEAQGTLAAENFCNNFPVGEVFTTTITVTQNLAAVTGQGTMRNITQTINGTIGLDGTLTLTGLPIVPEGQDVKILFWLLRKDSPNACRGNTVEVWMKPGFTPGEGAVEGSLQEFTRTNALY